MSAILSATPTPSLSSAAPTPTSSITPSVLADHARVVFNTDLLIIALLGCFSLYRMPRAIARLSRARAWTHGHFLRFIARRRMRSDKEKRIVGAHSIGGIPSEGGMDFASDAPHSLYTPEYISQRQRRRRLAKYSYPPHIPACPYFARPLIPLLRYRIRPGFSIGQLAVLTGYLGILSFVTFSGSSPFTDPARSGFLATSQLPIVFAFAAKNSVAGIPLCLSYEKVRIALKLLTLTVTFISPFFAPRSIIFTGSRVHF